MYRAMHAWVLLLIEEKMY